jgi:hypothetical protein
VRRTALIALVLTAALPGSAVAGHGKAKTEVDFNGYQGTMSFVRFSGTISSPKHACEIGRKVVIKESSGDGHISRGYTYSDSFGNFSLQRPPFPLVSGAFTATAKKRVAHGVTCKEGGDSLILP